MTSLEHHWKNPPPNSGMKVRALAGELRHTRHSWRGPALPSARTAAQRALHMAAATWRRRRTHTHLRWDNAQGRAAQCTHQCAICYHLAELWKWIFRIYWNGDFTPSLMPVMSTRNNLFPLQCKRNFMNLRSVLTS